MPVHPAAIQRSEVSEQKGNPQKIISFYVISSYAFKGMVKIVGGIALKNPPLIADGIHGFIDIIEHFALVFGGKQARKEDKINYPLNRQPLIDLMGIGIYFGVCLFGLSLIEQALGNILAVAINAGWIKVILPVWANDLLPDITPIGGKNLILAAGIFLFCYIISTIIYKLESRIARENNLKEMEDDAAELKGDAWLEFGTAVSFFVGWVITLFLSGDQFTQVTSLVTNSVMAVILFGLGVYLIKSGLPEIVDKYKNLMNKALDREKRIELEKVLNNRIPDGCELILPLVCYHRGEQLYVTGQIRVNRRLMASADIVVAQAENIVKKYLSDLNVDVKPLFAPISNKNEGDWDVEIEDIIINIFNVSKNRPCALAYEYLRKGRLTEAEEWLGENLPASVNERALTAYILAESAYVKADKSSQELKNRADQIETVLCNDLPLSMKMVLNSWLLIYVVTSNPDVSAVEAQRERLCQLIDYKQAIPSYALAEVYFSMGFSWERSKIYDLKKCKNYYRQAEAYYLQAGIRYEKDRFLNTWGHLETLLLLLGDAERHLLAALEIREMKKDKVGLTYTYGCLGDLYSRLGLFEEASYYYEKNLALLREMGVEHHIPSISVKLGESFIRNGLLKRDECLVLKGIELCHEGMKWNNAQAPQSTAVCFFSRKGQVKGWLGLALNTTDKLQKSKYALNAENILNDTKGNTIYEKAFEHILRGRYLGLIEDYVGAAEQLSYAADIYSNKMNYPGTEVSMNFYELGVRLEIYKMALKSKTSINEDENPIEMLTLNINNMGGMIGPLKGLLEELIDKYRMAIKNNNIEEALRKIEEIVWYIEG